MGKIYRHLETHQEVLMLRATKTVIEALAKLLRAREYADEVGVDPWKFAVEWRVLKARGLEETEARYLFARGLIELRREISIPGAFERTFVQHDVPRLSRDSVFVVTETGAAFYRGVCACAETSVPPSSPDRSTYPVAVHSSQTDERPRALLKPHWDPDRRELTFGGQIVKRYRVPSPNQELILSVFQEEEWPEFIDDPLPPMKDVDSITRLQATVKSLNRRQVKNLIRFSGNGGRKVIWSVPELSLPPLARDSFRF